MKQLQLPPTLPAFHMVDAVATTDGFAEFVVTDDEIRVHNLPSRLADHEALAVAQALFDSVLARMTRAETGRWE